MPIIDFHGKKAIQNYEPPFHLLEEDENLAINENGNSQDNILIEGDNLLALKALLPEYAGKVKCIYIDPPYNTNNKEWVYCDNIEISSKNDPAWAQVEKFLKSGNGVDFNDPSRHSKWLCMMYPRLKLLHKILSDDGVIFISIDDNEAHHLRMVMDEIFGEGGFVTSFVRKTKTMAGDDGRGIVKQFDSIVCYAKNSVFLKGFEKNFNGYKNPDKDPNGHWISGDPSAKSGGSGTYFEIINPFTNQVDLPPKGRFWAFSKLTMKDYIKNGKIKFKTNIRRGERGFIFKRYKNELKSSNNPLSSIFACENAYLNEVGNSDLKNIFNKDVFNYPKPVNLIKSLIFSSTTKSSIILDSFAGSGTTAHAVLELNKEDGGNRKVISIQLPEAIKEDKPAFKAGFKFVHEITYERIKRVIKGYKNAKNQEISGLGGGLKYYRLSSQLFTKEKDEIVPNTTWQQLAIYLYFTEFNHAITEKEKAKIKNPFIGEFGKSELYLIYKNPNENVLDKKFVEKIKDNSKKQKIVYADFIRLDEDYLKENNIIFRQIPYDIFYI